MDKITVVFPGQGKKFGRAELELIQRHKAELTVAEEIFGYSVERMIRDTPRELQKTEYAQPVGYLTAMLFYKELLDKIGKKPDFVVGHSLGEFGALTAGGFIDFESGLKLVFERGKIMSQANGGAMSAVVGKKPETIMDAIESEKTEDIDIANYNSPFQIVVSGPDNSINSLEKKLNEKGLKAIRLNVSGAFHSRYMTEVNEIFKKSLDTFSFKNGNEIKVMSSVRPEIYENSPKKNLSEQMVKPVRFIESINRIIYLGSYDFIQVDGGSGMINLIDDIKFGRALNERIKR